MKLTKTIIYSVFLGFLLGTHCVNAGTILSTKVIEVRGGSYWGETFLFRIDTSNYSAPECHDVDTVLGNKEGYVGIDTTKMGAEHWVSLVLMAYAAGKDVSVWTTGNCISASSKQVEELSTIALN